MQCSFCGYEYTLREMQADAPCPKCAEQRLLEERAAEMRAEKIKAAAALAPHVQKLIGEHRGAQPVVIVDVHMSFNSMVWFMVKWAIAAIPAMILLGLIGLALMMFVVGGFGGFAAILAR